MRSAFAERRGRAGDLVITAVEALSRYALRTGLSVLGVVLGVAAVIAMISVGEGARVDALQQVGLLGLDNLVVRSRPAPAGGGRIAVGDAARLRRLMPDVGLVSPDVERHLSVARGGTRVNAAVVGVAAEFRQILRLRLDRGRFLSPAEERSSNRVCVLGYRIARTLSGRGDVRGQAIRVAGEYCTVVGVLATRERDTGVVGGLTWRSLEDAVVVPLGMLLGRGIDVDPSQPVDEIWLQVRDGDRVAAAGRMLDRLLPRGASGEARADVIVPRELLAQRVRTQRTFRIVIGSVAALALLIGGIGIMNIMLTSVVERTREIGIRRAAGATCRVIRTQFMVEAVLMTVGGGLLGILLGAAASYAITAYAGWTTRMSFAGVAAAFAVSCAVGIASGIYPAIKAARLDPVDALRYE